jgi:hypothetical protein
MADLSRSLDAAEPPGDVLPALRALWWLRKGGLRTGPEWQRAHEICQAHEGTRGCDLVHGLAHWIEGDTGNADYWYRRAGSRRAARTSRPSGNAWNSDADRRPHFGGGSAGLGQIPSGRHAPCELRTFANNRLK